MSAEPNNAIPPIFNEHPLETMLSIAELLTTLSEIYQRHFPEILPVELMQFSHGIDLFWKIYTKHAQNPHKAIEIQRYFAQEFANLFITFNQQLINAKADEKMFANPVWRENSYFEFLKHLYQIISNYANQWLQSLEELDRKTKQQLHFYVTNFLSFICPTNHIWTNPEVMEATIQSGGNNLLRGFRNYLEDLVLNNGKLNVRMTDLKAFEVGKNLATTTGKVVFQNDLMQLIQYTPTTEEVNRTPILFVPPWINKYYVLDLSPENSLVKWLVEQGFTVFMISWVNPDRKLKNKEFADYMLEGPIQALNFVTKNLACDQVNMVGYCIGGTLLACALAYLKNKKDTRIKSATFFMSLLNFSNPGELGVFFDDAQIDALDKLMQQEGYLNGHLLDIAFNMLRPNDLIWPYYVNRYLLGKPSKAFDLLYWNSDSSNLPYKMYSFYLRNMYMENLLHKPGAITLDHVPIDLSTIDSPCFFLGSETDHITLWRSVYSGLNLLGGPIEFVLAESGHVRGVINPPSLKKYGFWNNTDFKHAKDYSHASKIWLENSTRHDGSWWPFWVEWLHKQDSQTVPARNITKFIEDAPGSYVMKRI